MEAPQPENSQPGFSKDFGQHFLQSYGIFPNICHRQGLTCHCWYPWGYPKNLVICHQNGLQTASLRIHIYIYTYLLCVFLKFYIQKINYFIPSPIHPNYIPTSGFISAHVKPSLWTVDGFVSQRGRSFCLTRTPPQVRKSIVRARSRCRPGGFFQQETWRHDDYNSSEQKQTFGMSRSWRGVTCWWF